MMVLVVAGVLLWRAMETERLTADHEGGFAPVPGLPIREPGRDLT